jgi:hypothetical protein
MSTINNGGPAFPAVGVPPWADHKRDKLERLRDEFAMAALAGMVSYVVEGATFENVAEDAYKAADAMLRAREVKP